MIATLCIAEIVYSPNATMSRNRGVKVDFDKDFNAFLKEVRPGEGSR